MKYKRLVKARYTISFYTAFVWLAFTGSASAFPRDGGPGGEIDPPEPGEDETGGANPTPNPDTTDGGATTCDGGGSGCLENPLKSDSILEFIEKIIDVLLIFAVPIIVLFIMYAGFLFVTARGSEDQIKKAKHALLWAVVGGVIVLGAKLIISVIKGTITQF